MVQVWTGALLGSMHVAVQRRGRLRNDADQHHGWRSRHSQSSQRRSIPRRSVQQGAKQHPLGNGGSALFKSVRGIRQSNRECTNHPFDGDERMDPVQLPVIYEPGMEHEPSEYVSRASEANGVQSGNLLQRNGLWNNKLSVPGHCNRHRLELSSPFFFKVRLDFGNNLYVPVS